MSQSDFTFLSVQYVTSESEVDSTSVSTNGAGLANVESEEQCSMQVDVPVGFIPNEMFAATCESPVFITMGSSIRMDLDEPVVAVSQEFFEPDRFLNDNAPPKRFSRTVWRSMARRILAL